MYCIVILFRITRLKINQNNKSSIKVSTSQDIGSCEPKHPIQGIVTVVSFS